MSDSWRPDTKWDCQLAAVPDIRQRISLVWSCTISRGKTWTRSLMAWRCQPSQKGPPPSNQASRCVKLDWVGSCSLQQRFQGSSELSSMCILAAELSICLCSILHCYALNALSVFTCNLCSPAAQLTLRLKVPNLNCLYLGHCPTVINLPWHNTWKFLLKYTFLCYSTKMISHTIS